MNSIFIQTEAKIFSLLIMIFLFVFIRKTFDTICREHNLVYMFSIVGTFISALSGITSNEYTQTFIFALCGCCYAAAAFFLCKYVFIRDDHENKTLRKIVIFVFSAAIGLLEYYSLTCGIGIITYLMCFAELAVFAVDQFNKIRIDKLTGLYNRYGMDIELRKQLRQYKRKNTDSFYVIVCDLDRFKYINDTWGHPQGDRALKLVSEALSRVSKRFKSTAFRIGGDEFVIITDTSEEGLASDITNAIKKEFDNIEFRDDFDINISIGNALYDGVISVNALLDSADKRLYESKKNKK